MDIDNLPAANNLTAKRLKLMGIKTSLQGTGTISASGNDLHKILTPERMTTARGAIVTLIDAELADVEAALADIDVQLE